MQQQNSAADLYAQDELCAAQAQLPDELVLADGDGRRMRRINSVQMPLRCTSDFEVEQLLGSGSYGEVMRVVNKIDNQVYAIKRVAISVGKARFRAGRSTHRPRGITPDTNLHPPIGTGGQEGPHYARGACTTFPFP